MAESLRDQLAANYDKITAEAPADDTPAPVADTPAAPASPPSSRIAEAPKAAPGAAKPAATDDDRPRGPDGKFIQKEDAPAKDAREPVQTAAKIHKAPAPGSPQAEAALP